VFGPYVAYGGITCNLLNESIGRDQITTHNHIKIRNIATPVLVIGTTQDPATPYAWAKALSRYIMGSHLITLEAEGHTGYGRVSACVDDVVDMYLVSGKIQFKNITCNR
jgi:predicted alpha/beta hydrolase family esterase